MGRASYLAVMAFIVVGSLWLEVGLRTRVLRRWRRLALSVLPAALVFCLWDIHAIGAGHWWFDPAALTGVLLPGSLPLDEVVFFLVVPVAAVLTLEAVRSATGLPVGDEAGGPGPDPWDGSAAGDSDAGDDAAGDGAAGGDAGGDGAAGRDATGNRAVPDDDREEQR